MNKIIKITMENEKYPILLKQIYDPPKCLYVMGNIEILNNQSIAIVGCREATEYGKKAATYFSYNLAKQNVTIVSGLARGIDSYSHIGTLKANGKTIAVIGSGLDIIYPKENEQLAKKIVEQGGAIISEYPLGTRPQKEYFPARNRIISGISQATLVIEAKEKSGSLITADFAMEQGKDVYSVPGNINSKNSVGTNNLIKDGAIPVSKFSDILI
ncbi:MAG: DNA-processing protein DprA [Clostridia bacterium]|nr:DNA-processing protein DprA [Clostridia bacterium]